MQHRARRHPVSLPVDLLVAGERRAGHLMDVAEGGAKVIAEGLAVGDRVTLAAARIAVVAEVRWARDGQAGLRFVAPLDRAGLAELTGKPLPFSTRRRGGGRSLHLR